MKNRINLPRIMLLIVLTVIMFRPVLGIEFGVLGSTTFSRFSSPDLAWKYRLDYSFGAFAKFDLKRWLQLQSELRFTSVRSSAVIPIRHYMKDMDVNLDKMVQSVELPVILHFAPFKWGKVQPNLQLGLSGAVNVHGSEYLEYEGQSSTQDIDDELEKIHTGFLAGAGIDFRLGRISLHLSGLWRIYFSPLAKNYLQQDIKSTGFLISLGLGLWHPGEDAR